jgi:hypothetical protein
MNTVDEWQTVARISDRDLERVALWRRVFDGDRVPVVSFVPQEVTLPGYEEPQWAYMLDLKAITDEQRFRLIQALAERFGLLEGEVETSLEEHGVPILASAVSVSSTDRALVMGAIL